MDITAICVVGFIVWGIYRLFELFVRKKERITIIEKLNFEELKTGVDLSIYSGEGGRFTSLRIALLLMGIGLGCLTGFILQDLYSVNNYNLRGVLYFSGITIFGGAGLLISYLIESTKKK